MLARTTSRITIDANSSAAQDTHIPTTTQPSTLTKPSTMQPTWVIIFTLTCIQLIILDSILAVHQTKPALEISNTYAARSDPSIEHRTHVYRGLKDPVCGPTVKGFRLKKKAKKVS